MRPIFMLFAGKQALAKQVFVFTEEHTNKNGSCKATTDAKRLVFMSIKLPLGKSGTAGKQALAKQVSLLKRKDCGKIIRK